jgi:hypothetical protein
MIDAGLYLSYVLTVVAVGGAAVAPVAFSLINGDMKSLAKTGIATIVLLVLFGVCWGMSSDEVTPVYEKANVMIPVDAAMSKSVGGGLYMFYVMFAISLVAIVYNEVSKFFK